MEETFKLMEEFEDKNNISISIRFYSDRSVSVQEFWDEEILYDGFIEGLNKFLKETQYKLAADGLCYSPVQIVNQ